MAEQNKKDIHEQQTDAFVSLLTRRGILGEQEIDNARLREARKEKKRNAWHNTQLLLKSYRRMVWVFSSYPEEVLQELEEPFKSFDKMADRLELELTLNNKRLENRLEALTRSRLLLDRLNEALTVLRSEPARGERLYQLIYITYLSPEKLRLDDILYRLDISQRHYYRLREQAISILSIRLWSAPRAEVDFWLEILTLFENPR